jgi:hypothetical protein
MGEIENEGMSTKKKVAAGAALGVAVPAAVAVGKKILGGDDSNDDGQQGQAQASQRGRRQSSSSRSSSGRGRSSSKSGASSRSSSARSRTSSAAKTTRSSSAAKTTRSSGSARVERTKEQLYNQAKRLKIKGRSNMTKAQLQRAVARKSS